MKLSTTILRSTAPLAFAVMGLHALGCMVGPSESGLTEEDFLGHAELGIAGDPGTTNHYDVDCFLDHGVQQTFRDLAAQAIVGPEGGTRLPAMPFMPAENATGTLAGCRMEMFELLVECAFGPGTILEDGESGKTREGALGYAPDWMSRALSTQEKELVTACMLQRLNPHGVSINILLERAAGPHPTTDYPVRESEAWGNLFDSAVALNPTRDPALPTNLAFNAYACDAGDKPTYCENEGELVTYSIENALMRTCYFNASDCGWTTLGACLTSCPYNPYNPTQCDAWSNRLRARARDDGSLCEAPGPG